MNTKEINTILRHIKSFLGAFPCDQLPKIKKRPASLVVNTDDSNKPGEHWIAIYLPLDGSAEYFDSFGLPPLRNHILTFLYEQSDGFIIYNNQTLQNIASSSCGLFCISYIKMREKHYSFCDVISHFNSIDNDRLAIKIALE